MTHHPPAELDRLELLFLRAQLRGLVLEPPRRVHEAGMGRVHETESRVVGGAGERLHDRGRGLARHRKTPACAAGCAGSVRFVRAGEIDPHQALLLHARIGAAADLGEVDLLAIAQRGNLDAAAAAVETPAVVSSRRSCRRRSGRNAAGCRGGDRCRAAQKRVHRVRARSAPARPAASCARIRPGRTSAPRSATYHNPRTSSALRSCIHCPRGDEPGCYIGMNGKSVSLGLAASLRQHAMHLAAMMGLVIEHVRDQKPLRLVHSCAFIAPEYHGSSPASAALSSRSAQSSMTASNALRSCFRSFQSA